MKRVLVTGANGFIGAHLIRHLSEKKVSVRAFILPKTHLKKESLVKNSPVEVFHGDIRDATSVSKAVKGCHKIFHLAAYCNLWANDRKIYEEVNAGGTQNICRAAETHGVSKLIYTSTCETIKSLDHKKLADERDWSLDGVKVGPYAISKCHGERAVMEYNLKGNHAVVVHPTLPLGPGDATPTPVGEMIQLFLRRKLSMYYPTGFNFVDVKDVAHGHYLAGEKGLSGEHYILGGQNLIFQTFLKKLESITNIPAPKKTINYPIAYAAAACMELFADWISHKKPMATREGLRAAKYPFYFSSAKSKMELGYNPGRIERALADEVDYYQSGGKLK